MSETRKLLENIQSNLNNIINESDKMLSGDETYVSKNQFNYSILGLIIDNKNKKFQFVSGQTMPLNKHKKLSGKALRNKARELKNAGYEEYKGYGSIPLDEDTNNLYKVHKDNKDRTKFIIALSKLPISNIKNDDFDAYITQIFDDKNNLKDTSREIGYKFSPVKSSAKQFNTKNEANSMAGLIKNNYSDEWKTVVVLPIDTLKESEESNTNLDIDLNTGVLPIVNIDMYSLNDRLPDSASYEELDEIIKDVAPKYIEETIQEVLPSAKITANKVYHPSQYNYSGDELEFNLTVNQDEYENLRKEALSNSEFENFLKSNYSSSSGFISTMPDSIEAFNRSKTWQSMVQVIMFALRNIDLDSVNDNYLDEFMEKVYQNFEFDEE